MTEEDFGEELGQLVADFDVSSDPGRVATLKTGIGALFELAGVLLPAELEAALSEQVQTTETWIVQFRNWIAGTEDGGVGEDGTGTGGYYPIIDRNGALVYLPSPALLVQVIAQGDPGQNARHNLGFYAAYNYGPSEVIAAYIAPDAETYDVSKCRAKAVGAVSTGSAVVTILKNGVSWGTITFTGGNANGVFSIPAPSHAAGDVLTFVAPVTADATLAGIAITLAGD